MADAIFSRQPGKAVRQKKRTKQAATVTSAADDQRITLACRLDRNADLLIFLGDHLAAERLSLRAAALREVGR